MRKRILIFGMLAFAAASIQSCGSDDDDCIGQAAGGNATADIIEPYDILPDSQPQTITLKGYASGDGSLSKTMLGSDGKSVCFSNGDMISVFEGSENRKFTTQAASGSQTADFSGNVADPKGRYYILYPYQSDATLSSGVFSAQLPANQAATPDSFDPAANLSVAISDAEGKFSLLNVGSLLRLETIEDFSKIVVKANQTSSGDYPKIAGNVAIEFGVDGKPVATAASDAVSEIALLPASGNTVISQGVYYVALLPSDCSGGITIEFYKNGEKTDGTYKRFQKQIVFARSKGANCGELITAKGFYIDMVKVSPALKGEDPDYTFIMGKDCRDAIPHKVTLTKDYYIGRFEVTLKLYKAVMGKLPSARTEGDKDDYPARYVSYDNAKKFISALNDITGKTFRLPTEAEWEYAARGGSSSNGYTYSGSDDLSKVGNTGGSPITVGTLQPNELGIYDMSGNVIEWCQDRYGESYYEDWQVDPQGPGESGAGYANENFVLRGGNYLNSSYPEYCEVADRNKQHPNVASEQYGMRLAL